MSLPERLREAMFQVQQIADGEGLANWAIEELEKAAKVGTEAAAELERLTALVAKAQIDRVRDEQPGDPEP